MTSTVNRPASRASWMAAATSGSMVSFTAIVPSKSSAKTRGFTVQTRPASSFADDDHGTTHVVEYCFRHAPKEQATDRSKSPSSQDYEVNVVTACNRHDLLRRIAVHDQTLDWISHFAELCDRVR